MSFIYVATLLLSVGTPAWAQVTEISIKSNESADLGPVYWLERVHCGSQLIDFAGVDLLEGPPGITLSIRKQDVIAVNNGPCTGAKLPGGVVIATVKEVPEKASVVIKYRVRYNTSYGVQQSNHTRQINLYP